MIMIYMLLNSKYLSPAQNSLLNAVSITPTGQQILVAANISKVQLIFPIPSNLSSVLPSSLKNETQVPPLFPSPLLHPINSINHLVYLLNISQILPQGSRRLKVLLHTTLNSLKKNIQLIKINDKKKERKINVHEGGIILVFPLKLFLVFQILRKSRKKVFQ